MISDTNPGSEDMLVDDDHKEGGPVYGPALPSAPSTENKETEKKNDEDEKIPYVWRIPNWAQVRAENEGHNKYYSEEFEKCGHKWRLLMFPNGHPTDKNAYNHISCYVEIRSLKNFSDNAYFDFSLYVMHPTDETKVQRKESQHEFTMMEVDRGFSTLFNLKHQDEFLFDGNELRVALWLQKRINPWATTRYHDSNYDSKKSTGYVGIRNQGATCYMNSLLQTLFHIPAFRKAVYDVPTDHLSEKAIALALQRVFYNLQTSAAAVSTKQLTASFGWDSVDAFQQHDVQEFSRVLMDNLEEKMKKTAVEGMIQKLFEGKSQSYIECINVPFKSERICSFMDVALNVKGIASLEKSFENYVEVETLEKDNQYRAEGFGKQDARKGERFLSFPPVLQIQLKRFEYDPIRDMMVKVNDRFEFPTHVNLAPFLPKDTTAETEYYLHSILVHSGSVHGGHYYAFIRPLNKSKPLFDSPWYKFDDETVTKVEEDEAVAGSFGGEVEHTTQFLGVKRTEKRPRLANAYMLVYLRKDMVNQTASSADQILANGGVITSPTPAPAAVPPTVAAEGVASGESKSDEGSKGEGGKEGAKEGESKEGEEKKKEDEATEAMKIVLDVCIPPTLVERFKQESIDAHQRSEQKKKAHLFIDIRVIAESKLFDIPVGVEFSKEYVDSNGLLQYNYDIETEVKVARAHTVEKFGEELQEMSGIPLSRQQYWKFTNRENGTRRPNGWIATSNEKVEEVWKDATLRRPTLWLKDTAFEGAVNQVNPDLFSTLNATNTANHEGGDRCIITFKYFDVLKQQLTVVSTAIFFKRDTIRDMKKYMRNVLRVKGLLGPPIESSDAAATLSEVSAAVGELQIDEELQYPIIAWEEEDVAHNKITLLQDNKTLKDCGLRNGDLVVFQLNIPDNQSERLKQSHADAYQQWDQYINDWREKMKNNAKDGTKSNESSNNNKDAAAPTAVETKPEHYPVKSEFFSDAPSYLKWLRDRIVIEFRQFPWRAHPSNPAKSHPDVHVFHLELNKNNKVIDIMQKVGTMFHIDYLKVKFYTHSAYALNGKPGPDTQPFMKKDVFKTSLIDYLGSADPIIYYEQTEFSLQELSIHRVIPILFLEVENNFKEYKFNVLVNRKGKVAHLEQAVWQKLQTLGVKLPDIQTIINNNNNNNGEESAAAAGGEGSSQQVEGVPQQQEGQQQQGGGEEKEKEVKDDDIPSVSSIPRYPLRFVMVNDRRISLYDDRQYGIDGVNHSLLGRDWLRVEIIPAEEQSIKDGGDDSVRWGAFFQPLSTGYRCFGHPFSFVVKKDDTVVDFRRTIAHRLNVSQEQADKFGIGLLNYTQYISLADTDIIMNKLDHSETLLIGIHDPERKPRGATGLTGGSWSSNNKSFFSRFAPANQAIKIYSTE